MKPPNYQEFCRVFSEMAPQPPTYLPSWLDPSLAWKQLSFTITNVVETFVLLDHRQGGSQGQLGLQDHRL